MAIRDKIIENSAQFLEPGEQVQAVMAGQTLSGWWAGLSTLIILFGNKYRAILVTDRRIAVLDAGKMSVTKPKSLIRNVPRNTRIGPATGIWHKTEALGEKLYIAKRFYKDIEAADAALPNPAGAPLPPPTA